MNLLGVFAKFWTKGSVKTRLAARLGDDAACDLYRELVERIVQRFSNVADRRVLAFWPPEARSAFAPFQLSGWELMPQASGDLGARMRNFFDSAWKTGTQRAVLIGSDSPTLPLEYVEQAFSLLQRYAVVLGPACDGGYYLVGAANDTPAIFDGVAWSTPEVWPQTVARLRASQTPFAVLPEWYDVDEIEDLRRLYQELSHLADADHRWRPLWDQVQRALSGPLK
jgi:rSAM/selenodomain-associated transferase 1